MKEVETQTEALSERDAEIASLKTSIGAFEEKIG